MNKEEITEMLKHRLATKKNLSYFTTRKERKGGKEGRREEGIRKEGERGEGEKSTFLALFKSAQLTLSIDPSRRPRGRPPSHSLQRVPFQDRVGVNPGSGLS